MAADYSAWCAHHVRILPLYIWFALTLNSSYSLDIGGLAALPLPALQEAVAAMVVPSNKSSTALTSATQSSDAALTTGSGSVSTSALPTASSLSSAPSQLPAESQASHSPTPAATSSASVRIPLSFGDD